MTEPQWAAGGPSFQLGLTPAEALQEIRSAVQLSYPLLPSDRRVSLALAMAWLDWLVQEQGQQSEGYCTKCPEPTDETGPNRPCAFHRDQQEQQS